MQELQGFRVASIIYWRTYFANQRGQDPKGLDALWNSVCSKIPEELFRKETSSPLRKLWEAEHELLLSSLHAKLEGFADSWLKSEAGIAYSDYIKMAK